MKKYLLLFSAILFFAFLFSTVSHLTSWFVNLKSCMIVLAGTIICSILSASPNAARNFVSNIPELLETQQSNFENLISEITDLAKTRRTKGLGELEKVSADIENNFLKQGIEMIVDGYKRPMILGTLEKRYENDIASRKKQDEFVHNLIKLSPIFGFTGTIIGLINVLNNMTSPELIGQGMGTALLTTFYGLVFANLVFLPISRRAAEIWSNDALEKSLIIEGVIDIADNINSKSIDYRLKSSLGDFFVQEKPHLKKAGSETETLGKLRSKVMKDLMAEK